MSEDRRELDGDDLETMHNFFDAVLELAYEKQIDISVAMQSLCRAVAYGGVVLAAEDEMSKRQFVSHAVEAISTHYEELSAAKREWDAKHD
jgi:hypothetical protein